MAKSPQKPPHCYRVALMFDFSYGSFRDMVDGIYEYAHTVTPWVMLTNMRGFADPIDASALRLDGLIGAFSSPQQVHWARQFNLPVVNLSIQLTDFPLPTVYADVSACAQLVVDHFRQRGFTNFAFFGPPLNGPTQLRGRAYEAYLAQASLRCHHFAPLTPPLKSSFTQYMMRHLTQWLQQLPKPVLIYTMDEYHALPVIGQCQLNNLAVPEQIAVIACGNDPMVRRMAEVPLAGVDLNGRAVGFAAATMLTQLMRGETPTQRVITVPPAGLNIQRSADIFAVANADLAQTLKLIHDHACDPLNVPGILKHVPVTRRWLERQFRTVLGHSIHDEIMRVRMEQAAHLLRATDLAIWQISERCGFKQEHHFTSSFRAHWQLTPIHYRRQHRLGLIPQKPKPPNPGQPKPI